MIRFWIKLGTEALCSHRLRSPPRRERKPPERRGNRPGKAPGQFRKSDKDCRGKHRPRQGRLEPVRTDRAWTGGLAACPKEYIGRREGHIRHRIAATATFPGNPAGRKKAGASVGARMPPPSAGRSRPPFSRNRPSGWPGFIGNPDLGGFSQLLAERPAPLAAEAGLDSDKLL